MVILRISILAYRLLIKMVEKSIIGAIFMKYLAKWFFLLSCIIVFAGFSSADKNDLLESEIDDLSKGEAAIEEPAEFLINPSIRFISSAVGGNFPVFSSQYAEDWEKILPPQEVVVINEDDNWLEVYIDDDTWWVDTNFTPSLDEINDAFLSLGDNISFYFYNIETGFQHGFNSDKAYIGASAPKVFYNYFLFTQDELENITLTEQERMWVKHVLRTSLDEFSHNLTANYGVVEYNRWLEEQGVYTLQTPKRHFGLPTKLNAEEAALLMSKIYHYFQTKTPNAVEFRKNMINNQVPFIVSNSYKVASKTGWLPSYLIRHDVAIVEAPSPYILVILSQNPKVSQNHLHYFKLLSALFEDFNNKWFVIGDQN